MIGSKHLRAWSRAVGKKISKAARKHARKIQKRVAKTAKKVGKRIAKAERKLTRMKPAKRKRMYTSTKVRQFKSPIQHGAHGGTFVVGKSGKKHYVHR